MNDSYLSHRADPLREMLEQFDGYIAAFRERSGLRVAGLTCDMLPAEIPASLGLVPLRLPSFISGHCTCEGIAGIARIGKVYDFLVVPRRCAGRGSVPRLDVPLHEFPCPAGWGSDAARDLERAIDDLLAAAGMPRLDRLDPGALRAVAGQYNRLRRIVRGIYAARREKPEALSHRDLAAVAEAAMVLPPDVIADPLAGLLEALRGSGGGGAGGVPTLVYSSFTDGSLLDEIEEAGCLVVEDDSCGGRRQFDLSHDLDSDRLAGEIMDAATYRPLCPSVRPVSERAELFYKMLKGHGIELVVFIEDACCAARARDIGELRVRLMRSGIDPLTVASSDAAAKVSEYVKRAGMR